MFWFGKTDKKEIYKFGIGGGLLEIIYIALVALLINSVNDIMNGANSILSVLAFLLLFVFSVAVSGVFVLGYPAYLGLQKRLREAILTLLTTILTMLVAGIIVFLIAIFNK
jgi:hypothetical protein